MHNGGRRSVPPYDAVVSEDPDDAPGGDQPSPFVAFAGMPVLSREAFVLHSFAV